MGKMQSKKTEEINKKPNVIVLSETILDVNKIHNVSKGKNFDGYMIIFNDRAFPVEISNEDFKLLKAKLTLVRNGSTRFNRCS